MGLSHTARSFSLSPADDPRDDPSDDGATGKEEPPQPANASAYGVGEGVG